MKESKRNVLVALSGGVDSSVAASIISKEYENAAGINLRLLTGLCPQNEKDEQDAAAVAQRFGLPFFVLDLSKEFLQSVIADFISSYKSGQTPNPCVVCNKHIKFGALLEYAKEHGFDTVATGHYARCEFDDARGRFILKKALDSTKDQSYMLYTLSQEQLSRTLFPLGSLSKDEVRLIAKELNVPVAEKKDSQDICFVKDEGYASFIERICGESFPCGNFVDSEGKILGTHKGIIRYTIGQRKGLGLSLPAPLYVLEKDISKNEVVLCEEEKLFSRTLIAKNINLIPFQKLDAPIKVSAKTRYSQKEAQAIAEQLDEDTLKITFDTPQRAITLGQSVVMYDKDTVIGGGIISELCKS